MTRRVRHRINLNRPSFENIPYSSYPDDLKNFFSTFKKMINRIYKILYQSDIGVQNEPQVKIQLKKIMPSLIKNIKSIKGNLITLAEYVHTYIKCIEIGKYRDKKLMITDESVSHAMYNTRFCVFTIPTSDIKMSELWICMTDQQRKDVCKMMNVIYYHGKRYEKKVGIIEKLRGVEKKKWKGVLSGIFCPGEQFFVNNISDGVFRKFVKKILDGKISFDHYVSGEKMVAEYIEYESNIEAQEDNIRLLTTSAIEQNEDLDGENDHREKVVGSTNKVLKTVIGTCVKNNVTNLKSVGNSAPVTKKIIEATKSDLCNQINQGEISRTELTDSCLSLLGMYTKNQQTEDPNMKMLSNVVSELGKHMKTKRMDSNTRRLISGLQKQFS